MNNDFISVDPNELEEVAGHLNDRRSELLDLINNVSQEMTQLRQNGWQGGSAAELIEQRFNLLRQQFNNRYLPAIADYIQFLRETAREYRDADTQQRQMIDQRFNAQTGRTF